MEKILSISVAAYNAEEWLARCLDSFCVSEVLDDIDVMIINDGSTDGTREVALGYAEKYPDTFRLIDKRNGGHGSTINTGIQAARGKYFKLVDADDWVERDGLIALVTSLKALDVDADIAPYYQVDAADEGNKSLCGNFSEKGKPGTGIISVEGLDAGRELYMHALTFRTDLLRDNFTPIDEHCFFVDLEYVVFYFRFVKTAHVSDTPVYDYLVGSAQQSINLANMVKRRDEHMRVYRRLLPYYAHGPACTDGVIEGAVISEYRVLLEIPDAAASRDELMQFDADLKRDDAILYKRTISNGVRACKETAMVVWLLRLLRFHGYSMIHKLIHAHG